MAETLASSFVHVHVLICTDTPVPGTPQVLRIGEGNPSHQATAHPCVNFTASLLLNLHVHGSFQTNTL